MQNKSKLLWLELFGLLLTITLALAQAYVGRDSGNTYISNSDVVIYNLHSSEITPTAFIEPAYEIVTQDGQNAMMRRCANRDCDIVDILPDRTPIRLVGSQTGESVGGSDIWFQVEHKGRFGFVFAELVRSTDLIAYLQRT